MIRLRFDLTVAKMGTYERLSDEQSWELFDRASRYFLHLSGEEFLQRWESGYNEDSDAEPGVVSVIMPFAHSG